MPFCPKCKYEYQDTVDVCPDCNTSLVDELENPNREQEAFVPCYSADDYVAADIACSALREAGIHSEVLKSGRPDYKAYTMDDYPATFYVIVPESRRADAERIIKEVLT